MKNWNNEIVNIDNKYYLLNSSLATAKRLQLTDTENIQKVDGEYYVYLVDSENKNGKCFVFDNGNKASNFYNTYTSSMSDKYMSHEYIELGIQFEDAAFRTAYSKNEEA